MAFERKKSGSRGSDFSRTQKKPAERVPIERTPDEWREKARSHLLNRLTRGPRSRFQLEQSLEKREVPQEISQEILDRFTEVGLIDDAAFAKAFAHDRRATRGLSKSALKRELSKLGVAPQLVQDALEDIESDHELELAIQLVAKRWNSVKSLDRQARQRRLFGFLGRRGFGGNIVSAAIRAVEDQQQA